MSYHTPTTSTGKKILGSPQRMPSMATKTTGNMTANIPGSKIETPTKPTIGMDELDLATTAEKNKKGYLSTYLEGQTPYNKLSNFLGSRK